MSTSKKTHSKIHKREDIPHGPNRYVISLSLYIESLWKVKTKKICIPSNKICFGAYEGSRSLILEMDIFKKKEIFEKLHLIIFGATYITF